MWQFWLLCYLSACAVVVVLIDVAVMIRLVVVAVAVEMVVATIVEVATNRGE